jgi:hypothetical protein
MKPPHKPSEKSGRFEEEPRMNDEERDIVRKFRQLCRMTDEYFNNMSPQDRDRMMQVHLAQARGPVRNGDLLRQAADAIALMRASVDRAGGAQ